MSEPNEGQSPLQWASELAQKRMEYDLLAGIPFEGLGGNAFPMPRLPELPEKHDGNLDTREPGTGSHGTCRILPPGMVLELEDITGRTVLHGYLDAKQALSLFAWLVQEKFTLEALAKEQ